MFLAGILRELMEHDPMEEVMIYVTPDPDDPEVEEGNAEGYEVTGVCTGYKDTDGVVHILDPEAVDSWTAQNEHTKVVVFQV